MRAVDVLMIGTGEYTTGYLQHATRSDKSAGVIALTVFDLRRQGAVERVLMTGSQGAKFPAIRAHVQQQLAGVYRDLDVSFDSFPADDQSDPAAYRHALQRLDPGSVVTVFTPDDTHFAIALEAIRRGCHVLVAKPLVKTLHEHQALQQAADEAGVLVAVELHKRWDPIYRDARDRIRELGEFGYFYSYMSQPKTQLETFRAWAGKSSDISYYLNSHHIDFHVWSVSHVARPVSVTATAATGIAQSMGIDTEDTISLAVQWQNASGSLGLAHYTASWAAPPSDVHSQQRFHYLGQHGEVNVDQAHRGYQLASDQAGFSSPNPLFMKYRPDAEGYFAGQDGYGYRSVADFVRAAQRINTGDSSLADERPKLATIHDTVLVTGVLQAGRMSLDQGGTAIGLVYDDRGRLTDISATQGASQ